MSHSKLAEFLPKFLDDNDMRHLKEFKLVILDWTYYSTFLPVDFIPLSSESEEEKNNCIKHTKAKTKSIKDNRICKRFHKTVLYEFTR